VIFEELQQYESKGTYTKGEDITRESAKHFCEEIAQHLQNFVKEAHGQKTAVQYNPRALGAAMNVYLKSPASYRQFCKDSLLCQPSTSYLQKLKSKQQVTDGFCPSTCLIQHTYRDNASINELADSAAANGGEEWGQVGFDEMKLTRGVVMNTKSHDTVGISKDFCDLNIIVKNLLDEDEVIKKEEPTVQVLQFCYRSTSGRMYNIMHFFNNGKLPANKILDCLFKVIMCCEAVGSKVFGLVCDAAGANSRLFKYLREKNKLPQDVAWLDEDCVSFENPWDKTRLIYMFHCATHNCKNMRGQNWQSDDDGPKDFINVHGEHIGKPFFTAAWVRDEMRADAGVQSLFQEHRLSKQGWFV